MGLNPVAALRNFHRSYLSRPARERGTSHFELATTGLMLAASLTPFGFFNAGYMTNPNVKPSTTNTVLGMTEVFGVPVMLLCNGLISLAAGQFGRMVYIPLALATVVKPPCGPLT